jgi:hypothetical protein
MEIQKIDPISLLVDNALSRPVRGFHKPRNESSKNPWIKVPEKAQKMHPEFSAAAVSFQQLDKIEKTITSLKEEISTMRRTLPPFPPGSQERVRLLKSYIGLRKLIEQLTVPPEIPVIRQKKEIDLPEISNPNADQEWEAALTGLEKTQEVIRQVRASMEKESVF